MSRNRFELLSFVMLSKGFNVFDLQHQSAMDFLFNNFDRPNYWLERSSRGNYTFRATWAGNEYRPCERRSIFRNDLMKLYCINRIQHNHVFCDATLSVDRNGVVVEANMFHPCW